MVDERFRNVPLHALTTTHAWLAIAKDGAVRYPRDVAPFAAVRDKSADSLAALASLMEDGETVFVMSEEPPQSPWLQTGEMVPVLQMVGPPAGAPSVAIDDDVEIVTMTANDSIAMVQLTDIAFPGFFRIATYKMGRYYGVRDGGELVAMAGERMALPGYSEVSGVCTRPGHTGRGYAARLIRRLMRDHADAGLRSFLHVKPANRRAIEVYERLGFTASNQLHLYPLSLQK